jgi:hypothetical protein
VWADCGNLK